MKKIKEGDFFGHFIVEEVVRPFEHGNALLKVRYEGSYVYGYLCAVDSRQYNLGNGPESIVSSLKDVCKNFAVLNSKHKGSEVSIQLPSHISSSVSTDSSFYVLGYFNDNLQAVGCSSTSVSFGDLKFLAQVIDLWHKKEVGHGSLHPIGMQKADDGKGWFFSCPIFPVEVLDAKTAWTYDFGAKNIEKDRRAIAQMVADVLNGSHSDIGGFSARLESFESAAGKIPVISSFINDKTITSAQLVANAVDCKAREDAEIIRRQKGRRLKKRIIKAAAVVLVMLSAAFLMAWSSLAGARKAKAQGNWQVCGDIATRLVNVCPWLPEAKELKAEAAHFIELNTTIEEVLGAQKRGDWQQCLEKAKLVLAMQPAHEAVILAKAEAEQNLALNTALAEARQMKESFHWQGCQAAAEKALKLEPAHAEALGLKTEAERMIANLSFAVAATRTAKENQDWQACLAQANAALLIEPNHAEALAHKKIAERKMTIGALLDRAREALDAKEWALCQTSAKAVLVLEAGHPEAIKFENKAKGMMQSVSAATTAARKAKANNDWRKCIEKANEALSLSPKNDEAKALVTEAEAGMRLEAALGAAVDAGAKSDWQTCLTQANAALLIQPGHAEALTLKRDAEQKIKVLAALVSAREAKVAQNWKLCAEMAAIATEITEEPEHSEAMVLKSDAERMLKQLASLVAAREAKVAMQWQKCKVQADEILLTDPEHFEALSLKKEAEIMIQNISTAISAAREAKTWKDWQGCVYECNLVLKLDAKNVEAKELKKEAEQLEKMSALLTMCYDYKSKNEWQAMIRECDRVLQLDANNVEAKELKREAEQNIRPTLNLKILCVDNKEVIAKMWDAKTVWQTNQPFHLKPNAKYNFLIWYRKFGNKAYWKKLEFTADWAGEKTTIVNLLDDNTTEWNDLNTLLQRLGVPSSYW